MTWTKPLSGTATAKIENRDLEIKHSFDTFTEGGVPVEALRCDVKIKYEEQGVDDEDYGFRPHDPVAAADDPARPTALTKAQETTLKGLLAKLRDHALWMANCTDDS